MVKKNVKRATKRLSTPTASRQSGEAAATDDTLRDRTEVLNSATPAATHKPATLTGALSMPALMLGSKLSRASLVPPQQAPKAAGQAERTILTGKATVLAEAPALPKVPKVKVTFVFPACACCPKHVSLSGDFNGWSSDAIPMKQCDDGHWETTLEIAPGRYEYKFVRDGEWMPDLLARENVLNGYGTLNSVIEVPAS